MMRRTTHFQQRIIRSCVCFSLLFFTLQFIVHTYPTLLYIWIELDIMHDLDVEPGMMHDNEGAPEVEKAWVLEDGHYKFKNSVNRLKLLDDGFYHDFEVDRIINPVIRALQHTKETELPIIVWWTSSHMNTQGRIKRCRLGDCYITSDKSFSSNLLTTAFLFNGMMFNVSDLPIPRKKYHEWGLQLEKTPNQYPLFLHKRVIELFNHTSTFKRESDFPLTTRLVESIDYILKPRKYTTEEKNVMKNIENIASIVYLQSDCFPPSDRDVYVKELMAHVKVDSYGACLHNKDYASQKHNKSIFVSDKKLEELLQKYKFIIAFENSICKDYVTEKLFRALSLGAIPIYKGAPNVHTWLPNNHSAIIVDDFKSPKELADYIKLLDSNVTAYDEYLKYKDTGIANTFLSETLKTRKWGFHTNHEMNHETGFECHVCDQIHKNKNRKHDGEDAKLRVATSDHFTCQSQAKYEFGSSQDETQRDVWRLHFKEAAEKLKILEKIL